MKIKFDRTRRIPERIFREIISNLKSIGAKFSPVDYSWELSDLGYQVLEKRLDGSGISSSLIKTPSVSLEDKTVDPYFCDQGWNIKRVKEEVKVPPVKGLPPFEDYQAEDILFVLQRKVAGIYLEMGLGKTYIISSALDILYRLGKVKKCLFVAPVCGVGSLYRDLIRFTNIPKDKILVGNSDLSPEDVFQENIDVVILSYVTIRTYYNRFWKTKEKMTNRLKSQKLLPEIESWIKGKVSMAVIDESHNIGNFSSLQTKAVLTLRGFDRRYTMSGTPATKPEKIFPQIEFLVPGYGPDNLYDALKMIASIGNQFSQMAVNYYRQEDIDAVINSLSKFSIRRQQKNCLNLPDLYFKKVYVPMTPAHRSAYTQASKIALEKIEKDPKIDPQTILSNLQYVKLAADNPNLLEKHTDKFKEIPIANQGKTKALDDLIEDIVENEREKIVIWTAHPLTANQLKEHYKNYNPVVITGEQTKEWGSNAGTEIQKILSEFESSEDSRILIASLLILNSAVTITHCRYQVFFDRTYSAETYQQAVKRLHRVGQSRSVVVYLLIYEDSIDEAVDENLEGKISLNERVMSLEGLQEVIFGKGK